MLRVCIPVQVLANTQGREGGDLIIVESTILELWVLEYLGTSLPTLMNTLTVTA